MLQLVIFFLFVGLEMTFLNGVHGSCIGFTQKFDDPRSLAALNGVLVGTGEILAGMLISCYGRTTFNSCRYPIVVIGIALHFTAYTGIILNIPNDAPPIAGDDNNNFDSWSDPLIGSPQVSLLTHSMYCSATR